MGLESCPLHFIGSGNENLNGNATKKLECTLCTSLIFIFSCRVVDPKLFWSAGPGSSWAKRKWLDLAAELDPDLDPHEPKMVYPDPHRSYCGFPTQFS
jgi:hypothetical protein